jgi:hypothetical protein
VKFMPGVALTQVFPVPTTPLELLVSSPATAGLISQVELLVSSSATAGLISQETVFIANVSLWRVQVFNELVRMQTDFNRGLVSSARLLRGLWRARVAAG